MCVRTPRLRPPPLNGGTPVVTTYNAANQISNAGFSYDNAGNLINDGTAAYTYDALNRTTVRGATTYGYNGDGTLVSQATSGVTTRYTQDLAAPLSQVLQTKVGKYWRVYHALAGRFAPHPRPGQPTSACPCAALVPWYPSGK